MFSQVFTEGVSQAVCVCVFSDCLIALLSPVPASPCLPACLSSCLYVCCCYDLSDDHHLSDSIAPSIVDFFSNADFWSGGAAAFSLLMGHPLFCSVQHAPAQLWKMVKVAFQPCIQVARPRLASRHICEPTTALGGMQQRF